MTDTICAKQGTRLLQTTLAKPWHYRRNGRYYLRIRPKGMTKHYFTISLRTADRSIAMDLSKDILRVLAVFHLDNPKATWEEIQPQLLYVAEGCLAAIHGDDSLAVYEAIYPDVQRGLSRASAMKTLSVAQHKAIGFGKRILGAALERNEGDAEGLVGIIKELEDQATEPTHLSSSVRSPQVIAQAPLVWSDLASEYLKEHKGEVSESSLTQIVSNHKVLGEAFEAIGVDDLRMHTRADLVALRTELAETRKPSTVNTLLAKLIAVMGWAVANDYLVKAYTTKLKFTKGTGSQREAFKRDQVVTMMEQANALPATSWERWGFSLLALTGARVGEVMQLGKADIKEVSGHWCIHINEEGDDKSVKTKHSVRLVPLTDGAFGFNLKEFLQAVEDGYLPSSNPVSAARKAGHLRTFTKDALGDNRTEFQTLHSVRHHMASSFQAQGISVAFAQAILGHSSQTMTYDTYGSGVPVKTLAGVLRGVLSDGPTVMPAMSAA
ncbi:tyrosine-type recombinase/integrase [Pseudomonas cichorii]|nr:tyrosine-type recombinase/integrase [Pseudomonas cichorii]MBX8511928.1 tyrosine-type recombinase/integrase [Pseudomonas cichorii]MBX8526678.1 tyrosine-type recombinase/integrase [Pseudomonas cichorii]